MEDRVEDRRGGQSGGRVCRMRVQDGCGQPEDMHVTGAPAQDGEYNRLVTSHCKEGGEMRIPAVTPGNKTDEQLTGPGRP